MKVSSYGFRDERFLKFHPQILVLSKVLAMVDGYYDQRPPHIEVFLEIIGLETLKKNSNRVIFKVTLSLGASFLPLFHPQFECGCKLRKTLVTFQCGSIQKICRFFF